MSLIVNNEKVGGSSLKWLGSAHATNEAQTVTLKVDAFKAVSYTHLTLPTTPYV